MPKDLPDSMMARLVSTSEAGCLREVNHRLMWGMELVIQGNFNDELAAKSKLESLQPFPPVID